MVKDHSDSEKGKVLLPLNELLFPFSSYMHYHTDMTAHVMAFVIPVVEHWLEQK